MKIPTTQFLFIHTHTHTHTHNNCSLIATSTIVKEMRHKGKKQTLTEGQKEKERQRKSVQYIKQGFKCKAGRIKRAKGIGREDTQRGRVRVRDREVYGIQHDRICKTDVI